MSDEPRIIRNLARCKKCGDIVESRYTWDFKRCSCGSIAVDGGLDYLKRVGNMSDFIDLSEFEPNA